MSISLICGHCEHGFTIRDEWAGKRIKCPECHTRLEVPGNDARRGETGSGSSLSDFMQWAGSNTGMAGQEDANWYLQTASGRQYGPVDRRLLDYWQRLGAVTSRCQVLREGDSQWRWASELYPQLGSGGVAVAVALEGSSSIGSNVGGSSPSGFSPSGSNPGSSGGSNRLW
jgi:hypothetical protein